MLSGCRSAQRHRTSRAEPYHGQPVASAEAAVITGESARVIRALRQPPASAVLVLRFTASTSAEEIAATMGIGPSSVRSAHRALCLPRPHARGPHEHARTRCARRCTKPARRSPPQSVPPLRMHDGWRPQAAGHREPPPLVSPPARARWPRRRCRGGGGAALAGHLRQLPRPRPTARGARHRAGPRAPSAGGRRRSATCRLTTSTWSASRGPRSGAEVHATTTGAVLATIRPPKPFGLFDWVSGASDDRVHSRHTALVAHQPGRCGREARQHRR